MADEKKPGLFDSLKKLVDQSLEPARHLPLPGRNKSTAPLARATDRLATEAPSTAPLPAKQTGRISPEASGEQLSPKRLAIIDDFMNGRLESEQLREPTFLYKVVSEERAYQTGRLLTLREQFRGLQGAEAAAVEAELRRTQAIVQNLFKVLKFITGKQGHTGGTDFL